MIAPPIAIRSGEEFARDLALRSKSRALRVYVAGPSREMARCVAVVAAVRAAGHDITHDWTEQMRASTQTDAEMATDELRPHLTADLDGIEAADALLLLLPQSGSASSGQCVELGYAICLARRVRSIPIVTSRGYVAPDPTRCERCGWPLHTRVLDGCVAGNCSQRPLPPEPAARPQANGWARSFGDELHETDAEAIAALQGCR